MECLRSAPARLDDYFRVIKKRKMNKDRTFKLNNKSYEGPSALIDRWVDVKFHDDDRDTIEVFFEGKSYGKAILVNAHLNSKIGRDYNNKSGELFDGGKDGSI